MPNTLSLALWFGLPALGAGWILINARRRMRRTLDALLDEACATVSKRLDHNDALLDGLAALIELGHDPAEARWQAYVHDLVRRYPHLYMVSCQVRVEAAGRPAFEHRASQREGREVRIRDFAITGDRTWRVAPARARYFPAVAMAPRVIAAQDFIGYDAYGDPLFRAAIEQAGRSGLAAATAPFDLIEGGRAYACARALMIEPALDEAGRPLASHVVSLLIRAEGLLAGLRLPVGAGVELRHPEHGDALLGAVGSMRPSARAKRRLLSQSQPFELHLSLPAVSRGDVGRAVGTLRRVWTSLVDDRLLAASTLRRERLRSAAALRDLAASERRAEALRARSLDDLGASVAHELNQPLAAVVAYNQAALRMFDRIAPLRDESPSQAVAELRQALEGSLEQSHRASALIERLRSLVRRQPLHFERVWLQDIAAAAARLAQAQLDAAGITLRYDAPMAPIQVTGDAVLLEQLVGNLLHNALQAHASAAATAPWIEIGIAADAQDCRLCVADNGPGIAPAQRERLFHPFHSTRPDGLGLGLVVCASIAQAHGGSIALEPSDAGARFVLKLPLATSEA